MKKFILFLSGCFIITLIGLGAISQTPYYLYYKVFNDGVDLEYFKSKNVDNKFVKPIVFEYESVEDQHIEKNFWEKLPVGHSNLLIPTRHPYLKPIPLIQTNLKRVGKALRPRIGIKMINSGKKTAVHFIPKEDFSFKYYLRDHKLFQLPIFKNNILGLSIDKVWSDLFQLDLTILGSSKYEFDNFFSYYSINLKKLVYNLFILNLRKKMFTSSFQHITYFKDNQIGILEIMNSNLFREEVIFYLKDNIVQSYSLKTLRKDDSVRFFRIQTLQQLEYKSVNQETADSVFNTYQTFSYKTKISYRGFSYLYSVWSHSYDRKEFMKGMIQYIERGEGAYNFLEPLYMYSLKTFGTTFSDRSTSGEESEMIRLRRNIRIEENKKIEDEKRKEVKKSEHEFKNKAERTEFFLKKYNKTSGEAHSEMTVD